MDLSKAFNTLNHPLLLAKLYAYGFSKQEIICQTENKRSNVFSSWKDLMLVMPQGSVLEPLLFNIYLNDLFLKDVGICNFGYVISLHIILTKV